VREGGSSLAGDLELHASCLGHALGGVEDFDADEIPRCIVVEDDARPALVVLGYSGLQSQRKRIGLRIVDCLPDSLLYLSILLVR